MFKISNPSIPTRTKAAAIKTQPLNGAVLARKAATPLTYTYYSNITVSGKTIRLNGEAPTGQIAAVKIGSKTYWANRGHFIYNPSTQTINFKIDVNLSISFLVYSTSPQATSNKFKSNEIIDIPDLFKKYNVREIQLSRPWRSHPSGSFKIYSLIPYQGQILSEFPNGKEIDLYGISYRVAASTWEINPKTNKLVVSVELQGYWQGRGNTIRNPLDEPVRLLDLVKEGKSYYLSKLAAKVGVRLTGAAGIKIKVPKGTGETESTNLGSEIERVITQGLFLDYSSKTAIKCQKYNNQPIHLIEDHQVRDEALTFAANGHGARYEGVQLAHEYSRVKLDIQSDKEDENRSKTGVRVILKSGDLEPQTLPTTKMGGYDIAYSLDYLRSPSNSFDNGGVTKTLKTSHLIDGTTIKEIEETYGFMFTSLDVYLINGERISYGKANGLSQFWTKVKETTTIYNYRDDGYLESTTTTGWEHFRERKESGEKPEEFDLIKFQQELNDATDQAERTRITANMALYQYKKRSLTVPTTYELESKKPFYKDLQSADPEPFYVRRQLTQENNLTITPDPDSTLSEPKPPIVSGIQRIDRIENAIAAPIGLNAAQSPEIFKTIQLTQTKEEANFQNFASSNNYQESLGRPNDQQYFKLVEPSDEVTEEPDEQKEQETYYASTPNAPTIDRRIYSQSISFPGADSLSKILLAAHADLCMKNTESLTLTLNVDRDKKYKSGDRVSYSGYLWTIKNISDEQDVKGKLLINTSFKLELGVFLDAPLNVSKFGKE